MKWIYLFLSLLLVSVLITSPVSHASECGDTPPSGNSEELTKYIESCNQKIAENKNQQSTLKQVISGINTKISLAQAQINQTEAQIAGLEKDITVLSGVIDTVNISMDQLAALYISRVRESYKILRTQRLTQIFASKSLSQLLESQKYLNTIKAKDELILTELEKSRLDYDQQKTNKEAKQKEVEALQTKLITQKKDLDGQQTEKQRLLTVTQNDEKKFQEMLSKARAELAAIESIIAGQGTETLVGDITEGQQIASVIPGSSACSTGGHLHFEVVINGTHQNPTNYLSSKNITWDNAPDGPFSFTGNWRWPLEETIRLTQGYGKTAYSSRYAGGLHTGIDIVNTANYSVKSVKDGTLYRGSIKCGGGILKYVVVKHNDSNIKTYYLHVNYF